MIFLLLTKMVTADLYSCDEGANASVTFGGMTVDCGTVIPYSTAHYVVAPPVIAFDSEDAFYVVAMVDPDAPSAQDPSYREVRHYLVGNVDKATLATGVFDDALSDFVNPAPPEGSGYHRYVQLIYRQPAHLDFVVNASILNFNITDFALSYNLTGPVASNFFKTQYECSADDTQCGGGVTDEAPIDCCSDFDCFKKNASYYQCLAACPADPTWACANTSLLAAVTN